MTDPVPLTDADRMALRRGDIVLVRMDDGFVRQCTVRHEPWQLGHGEWVLGIAGIAGGYHLSRVVSIVSTAYSRGPVTTEGV